MNTEATRNDYDTHPFYNSGYLKKDSYTLESPESKFFSWLEAWLKRVGLDAFNPHCRSFPNILKNGPNGCSILGFWHSFASGVIEKWHACHPDEVGCDQFVWTVLACAILDKHQKNNSKKICEPRGNRVPDPMLCLLVWTSHYLKVPCKRIVQNLLQEIISCCGHLRFVFAFLSGISLEEYVHYMGITDAAFHDVLCDKYFEDIAEYDSVYQDTKSLLLYVIKHLTPLHTKHALQSRRPPPFTLSQVINSPILHHKQAFSPLTIAVSRQDAPLVKSLLDLGSCGCTPYYYPLLDQKLSAERTLIHYINSAIAVRSLLINSTTSIADSSAEQLLQEILPKLDQLNEGIDQVSTYAPLMRRSLYRSEMKKANNQWFGGDNKVELHCDIADRWNVGDQQTFPSLQHACRIAIRRQILAADRKLLLKAVARLPLPGIMKRYLNLEMD